jgi:hypothetical protein
MIILNSLDKEEERLQESDLIGAPSVMWELYLEAVNSKDPVSQYQADVLKKIHSIVCAIVYGSIEIKKH